ncbi:DUF2326 domain-containing protein [Rhizobium ruizarguesonis]|uniref:DUF2326 domain-containing protein n=1 Tax=Rhizobium ruizarguesonis TaxID=2081791 RepID=UPI0018D5130B|nr:DUF2326 domain-containing protein [Rhizobium ruizarguesonis]
MSGPEFTHGPKQTHRRRVFGHRPRHASGHEVAAIHSISVCPDEDRDPASRRPGILIHDSHLFADVDARQVATAIELDARLAEALGVQYLVLMNSDEFAKLQFPKEFDPQSAILDVKIDCQSAPNIDPFCLSNFDPPVL